MDSDYKKEHLKRAHKDETNITFTFITDAKQPKLSFGPVQPSTSLSAHPK